MQEPESDPISIGNMLVRAGLLTQKQLHHAVKEQAISGERKLGAVICALGYATREQIEEVLNRQAVLRAENEEEVLHVVLARLTAATEHLRAVATALEGLASDISSATALRSPHHAEHS